jgi:uncharacterized protein (DUF983 family)
MGAMSTAHYRVPVRPLLPAMLRGLTGHCPHCGEGQLFYRYLKINHDCPACGHELDRYPADDGPAYFTILLVGHLVVAPLLFFPFIWQAPVALVVPGILIPLATLTLTLLPRVKGAVVGLLYANNVNRQDQAIPSADQAD